MILMVLTHSRCNILELEHFKRFRLAALQVFLNGVRVFIHSAFVRSRTGSCMTARGFSMLQFFLKEYNLSVFLVLRNFSKCSVWVHNQGTDWGWRFVWHSVTDTQTRQLMIRLNLRSVMLHSAITTWVIIVVLRGALSLYLLNLLISSKHSWSFRTRFCLFYAHVHCFLELIESFASCNSVFRSNLVKLHVIIVRSDSLRWNFVGLPWWCH